MQEATGEQVRAGIELNLEARSTADPGRLQLKRATEAARRAGLRAARNHRIDWRVLEAISTQEPFFLRCVEKQTGDMVKHGFKVVKVGDEDKHDSDDLVQAWLRNEFILSRIRQALINAHVYKEGLVEIEWDDGGAPETAVPDDALPVTVHVIDTVGIRFEKGKGEDADKEFLVQDLGGQRPVVLHPSRYHRFHFHFVGRPVSSAEIAYHALMAQVKGVQGGGEVVYNAGQPKAHAQVKDPKPNELDETTEMINSDDFVRGYATDDRTIITQLNPATFDPSPFHAEWHLCAAAAVGVPVMMGEGAQAGAVTGSETNVADYHSDLRLVETTILEPFFTILVRHFVGSAEFDISWIDPPTMPTVEATQRREKAAALNQFIAAGLTKEAAAREAGLKLSEEDFEEEPEGIMPPVMPGPGGQPPPGTIPRLTPEQQAEVERKGAPPAA